MRELGARCVLIVAIALVPGQAATAETGRSAPDAAGIRQRVESFAMQHGEFALGSRDLERLVTVLVRARAHGTAREPDGQSSPAERVSDREIVHAIHTLGLRPDGSERRESEGTKPTAGGGWPETGSQWVPSARGAKSLDLRAAGVAKPTRLPAGGLQRIAVEAAPANDACASATAIGLGSFAGSTVEATNDGAADCGNSATSADIWYRFTAPADATYAFHTIDSTFDTVLSLHSSCPGTILNQLECDDDTIDLQSLVVWSSATQGSEILVRVAGFGGATGAVALSAVGVGEISGVVEEAGTQLPLEGVAVEISYVSGDFAASTFSEADGTYTVAELPEGTYFARTDNGSGHLDEVYDDLPCWLGCDVTTGSGISVTSGTPTTGIDFSLDPGGRISGVITDSTSKLPIEGVSVDFFEANGDYVTFGTSNPSGAFESAKGLPTGTYRAVTDNDSGYLDELYDNLSCWNDCDVTTGSDIAVTTGATTGDVDFALVAGGAISGTVTDAATALPLENVEIVIFDAGDNYITYGYSAPDGTYESYQGLASGTYYVRTYSLFDPDYRGALYSGKPCPFDECLPSTGTPVAVTVSLVTPGVNFALKRRFLAADGFDSGGYGAWSGGTSGPFCAHSMCQEGAALDGACDPCVAQIVAGDSYCTETEWDSGCVVDTYATCGVTTCEWEWE